jgi:hypothetical protein
VVLLLPFVGDDELRSRLGAWRHCQLDALKGLSQTRVYSLYPHKSGQVNKKAQISEIYCFPSVRSDFADLTSRVLQLFGAHHTPRLPPQVFGKVDGKHLSKNTLDYGIFEYFILFNMASLLSSHLEQISLCSNSIAELPFQGPKIFTNALLSAHDITALIRDTEAHERALFHLAPPPLPTRASNSDFASTATSSTTQPSNRRATVYGGPRQPKNKAVAAVLGGDLYNKTRAPETTRQKGDINVEALLQGAEKLAAVYPIPGANERISQLSRRYHQLAANIQHYEGRVALQSRELERMHRPSGAGDYDDDEDIVETEDQPVDEGQYVAPMTQEDMMGEEEEIRELESKKRSLEARVTGMERDLGGLMR